MELTHDLGDKPSLLEQVFIPARQRAGSPMGRNSVNAIFGCLVSLGGSLLLIQNLLSRDYKMLWLPVLLLCAGLFMLLRHQSDDDLMQSGDGDRCTTCRGTGTVYSAEWNDWRKTGPVHTIREPCPECQGADLPRS
jgi:hypothetical protein